MANKRKVAVCIGVADMRTRKFPYLLGAVNSAKAFEEWASAVNYETRLLVDADKPVTFEQFRFAFEAALAGPRATPLKMEDSRETIDEALAAAEPIGRLIVYFVGHGMIKEMEQSLWFLSNSYGEKRVVDAEKLRRRLYSFGVEQICVVTDACQSVAKTIDLLDPTLDGVLGDGPRPCKVEPPFDKYIAAQDGEETFNVPGRSPAEHRALFSGVLMEGLWGLNPAAYLAPDNKFVTSQSLRSYLENETPRRAVIYKRELNPRIVTNLKAGRDVYFGDVPPSRPAPTYQWPDPDTLLGHERKTEETLASDPPLLARRFVTSIWNAMRAPRIDFWSFDTAEPSPPNPEENAQARLADALGRIRGQSHPVSFETGSGFAVAPAAIVRVLTPPGVVSGEPGVLNWVHIGPSHESRLQRAVPVLVEMAQGVSLALTALPNFIATVQADENGAPALVYRRAYAEPKPLFSEEILSRLEVGGLDGETLRDETARIRLFKHDDPTLAAVAAYVYESLGDLGSVRQMAYFFVARGQPIPFDVAMLSRLRVRREAEKLVAEVPETHERPPLTEIEAGNSWLYAGTPACEGEVGGVWPWMRRGWTLLDDYYDRNSALIDPALPPIAEQLCRSRFAALRPEGAAALAELFKLTKQ